METILVESAVRSVLVAAAVALVLWTLRIRTAGARHSAWTAVLVTMLLLPAWSAIGFSVAVPVLRPAPNTLAVAPISESPLAGTRRAVDTTSRAVTTAAEPARVFSRRIVIGALYLAGLLLLLARLVIGTAQAIRLRRSATIVSGRATSDRCATPITVGWFRPSPILPASWPEWSADQLYAVLTHEQTHARRHDTLVQWVALLNRAIFWFHPLAWWLERRLAALAEEACDAAVLAAGHSPQNYSAYLLEMARSVTRRGGRVRAVGVAMPGPALKPRLRRILVGISDTPVSRARTFSTFVLCATSSAAFATATLAPRQGAAAFDVVSIKPCATERMVPGVAPPVPAGARRGGAAGFHAQTTPGRVYWDCVTLATLVDQAYADKDHPLKNMVGDSRPPSAVGPVHPKRVRGGPSWAESDKFTIEATAPVDVTNAGLSGAAGQNLVVLPATMAQALRAVLEDRFKVKVHRASEEQDMYGLRIAPNGLTDRMRPTKPGDCVTSADYFAADPAARANLSICGRYLVTMTSWQFTGGTMPLLTDALSSRTDRFVLNETGDAGTYNFVLDLGPADGTGGGFENRTSRGLALLGLRLQPTKAFAEYLVLDHAEPPTPNGPIPPPPQGPRIR